MTDAKALLDLTAVDLQLMKIKKLLDELPQRAQLLQLRTKQAEVNSKAGQVEHLRLQSDQAVAKLQDEGASLEAKTAEVQKQIDECRDHKEVAALAKEMQSLRRRLEKIEFDTLKELEKSDKISVVEKQVKAA
jgi:predicted  nucleic acid-binding Zn-ribbon protein